MGWRERVSRKIRNRHRAGIPEHVERKVENVLRPKSGQVAPSSQRRPVDRIKEREADVDPWDRSRWEGSE